MSSRHARPIATLPTWVHGHEPTARRHRPLHADLQTDVLVVGGGIAGVTTAFLLRREGFDVVLVDDGPIGGGETERTTAHLANALDDRFVELERMHGAEGARIAAESHTEAIALIESIVEQEKIDCDFARLDGWLFTDGATGTAEKLAQEMEAAKRAGLHVEMFNRIPDLPWHTGAALRFPRQGQIHPLKYLLGLVNAFLDDGGSVYCGTHISQIEGGPQPRAVTSDGHVIRASSIVVATNSPVNDRVAVHTKQVAYRTYAIALPVPHAAMPTALYWDTADPYHYVRLQRAVDGGDDTLIIGGEDHRTGEVVDAAERWTKLASWAQARFPCGDEILAQWSGQVLEPVDGLAFIGKDPAGADNVFIATGDSGHGMTHGTIAGLILTNLVGGVDHPWAKVYDPKRKPLGALSHYAAENLKTASSYAQYLNPTSPNVESIRRGSGAVIRRGLAPVAVFCDDRGELHSCSGVCPHLGAPLVWNEAEKSFDCPAHGSRFDAMGHVLNGPANADLHPVDAPAQEQEQEGDRVGLFSSPEPLKEA